MNIIVCVKQVNDPEAPPSSFKIDPNSNKVVPPVGVPPVLSTFDEYAVEAAIRVKEKTGGKITALSLGINLLRDVVKKPLSMGVDELVLLEDPAYIDGDSWSTSFALFTAIKKIGNYDLILCGRQSADWDAGQVGPGIAELLGLPCITLARKLEVEGNRLKVERVIPDGFELIESTLPALVTLSNEHPAPRYPNVKGIMMAKRKEPIVWKPSDLGLDVAKIGPSGRRTRLIKLYQPVRESHCEIVTADTPEEAGLKLGQKLRDVKVL
ncbi:MAG TPA: electron transfer flavoprotein subunit beta/FixA family protein [Dehalococcoidales bacterium]|nr:electron transfer flavoprotein subunit beta/FixA family protein [Dehalococcoidales bacterium]